MKIKFRRGGQATRWPWHQVEIRAMRRCVTINLSRVNPL